MWREKQAHQELPRIRISMGMLPWGFPAGIWASLSLQRPHLSCGVYLGQGPCVAALLPPTSPSSVIRTSSLSVTLREVTPSLHY